jgi:CHAT domain-containing protein
MTRFLIAIAAIVGFCVTPSHSQFFSACDCGDETELDKSIRAHAEHDYRMDWKFLATYYYQGKLPPNFLATVPKDVRHFLSQSSNMRPALLYHAYNEKNGRFCAWLMPHNEAVVSEVVEIEQARFISLIPRLHRALGIYDSTNKRLPLRRNIRPLASSASSKESLPEVISELSNLLFPQSIAKALANGSINMLIIVPIYSFGTIPFSLLQIQGRPLVDFMPVFVLPSFSALKQKKPDKKATQFSHAIILGDPIAPGNTGWTFPRLPGAKAEALEVARIVNASALVDSEATSANLKNRLQRQREVKLIYLATHAVADSENPLDGSFVLLADGLWSAREIAKLPLKKSRPLVVLSACQTGLGKGFDVGTTGLARAFHEAGASTVIMSLWSIDDQATKYLMIEFMKFLQQFPVEVALQLAMQRARVVYPDPVYWAGFSIFGAPLLWSE